MKSTKLQARHNAIETGVSNAIDTVQIDKAMTAEEAFAGLKAFVADGLLGHGFDDNVTEADMTYARKRFYL